MSAAAVETGWALPRLLTGIRSDRALTLAEHTATFGPLVRRRDLIETVARAGLHGRGGAAFPTARKLSAVVEQRGEPVVVVNAAEGEPASSKDRALIRLTPHLVLDGAALVADAIGAKHVVVVIAENARPEHHALAQALRERRGAFEIATVPAGFVSGEETALIQAIEGRPAKPTLKPPYPFERGYLVQNAETLAHVALIGRHGAQWFRSAGTHEAPGTALISLSGAVAQPGVHEIELGATLADVVASLGGTNEPVSAFLVAGFFGRWVTARDAASLELTASTLGAGVIVAHPARACPIAETARIARYLAGESAGQCGPCVYGLDAIVGALESLARRDSDAPLAVSRLERWTAQVRGRGACRHPDGAARLVASALDAFPAEIARLARR
ncbi:MAG TPA: NADH-ubiquinone oxidoreductase-F iron-sulfur binding region domain-containing protein [Gaiellaceae bacterium]|jgi:NADH:ubiquinone oxidoreductase subunit F (NADH-binding)